MFIIYQIIQPTPAPSSTQFFDLCKNKFQETTKDHLILESYNNYLNRCGLKDMIDLFHICKLKSLVQNIVLSVHSVKNEIDRLVFDYLLEIALEHSIYDEITQISTVETSKNISKLFLNEKMQAEQTISKVS